MPTHIRRLILLLLAFGALALTVRHFVVDKSFYRYGHYRGDALGEIARDQPQFRGSASCQSCHAAEYAAWAASPHHRPGGIVQCEVCHGPGAGRDPARGYMHAATGPVHPDSLRLAVPTDSRALCTACHERIVGRPAQQRQIVLSDHAGAQQCSLCHDVHAPATLKGGLAPASLAGDAAAGQRKSAACIACHGAGGVSTAGLLGPTLAGQSRAYLSAALTAYKSGARSNPIMLGVASALSAADIEDIAAWFSSRKCAVSAGDAAQVAAARNAGAAMCANCHGTNGVATSAAWPNLLGQSPGYLQSALGAYAGADRSHPVMSTLARSLNEAEVARLAAWYGAAVCK
jgi:cytochrome c553